MLNDSFITEVQDEIAVRVDFLTVRTAECQMNCFR